MKSSNPKYFLLDGFEATGTRWWIELLNHEELNLSQISNLSVKSKKLIRDFEKKFSRFDKDSLLCEINRSKSIHFDNELASIIMIAQELYLMTESLFNITIESELVRSGYGKRLPLVGDQICNPINSIKVDDKSISLLNTSIDIGGLGKGYLIKKLKNLLLDKIPNIQFIINAGGDLYVHSDSNQEITLASPTRDKILGKLNIRNVALCCSSPELRSWESKSKRYNHIINPNQTELLTKNNSFVIHSSPTIADALATVMTMQITPEKMQKILADLNAKVLITDSHGKVIFNTL